MEEILILKNILQDYITKQSVVDKNILSLFIDGEYKEYEIARITGCSLSKISRVIRGLRVYLRKFNYN